jgi:hypothetical protein
MINNHLPYADSIDGEVVEDTAAKELVIPTQARLLAANQPYPRGGQPQPILAPWMKDCAEFIYKMQDVGKRAAHILGWHLCHAPANALRVLWLPSGDCALSSLGLRGGYSIWTAAGSTN